MSLRLRFFLLIVLTFLSGVTAQAQSFALGTLLGPIPSSDKSVKIAFFDADLTLRHTATAGHYSPSSIQDQVLYDDVAEKIQALNRQGYMVAIISNQGKVSSPADWARQLAIFNSLRTQLAQKNAFINYINIDGSQYPENRKPNLGLYRQIERLLGERGLAIDSLSSFFVGDGAFLKDENTALSDLIPKDHSNADREFARNAGIAFFHAAEYFGRREVKLPVADPSWNQVERTIEQKQFEIAALEKNLENRMMNPQDLQTAQDQAILEITAEVTLQIEKLVQSHSNDKEWEKLRPLVIQVKDLQNAGEKEKALKAFQRLVDASGQSGLRQHKWTTRWMGLFQRWLNQVRENLRDRTANKNHLSNEDYIFGTKRFSKQLLELQQKKWIPLQPPAPLCQRAFSL